MTGITTFRPLEKISSSELRLELKLRKGPDWICVGCGYHADGSGQWPCPDCGKRGYWTGGWNVEHPHHFHACRLAWESRICSYHRPIASELCAVGIGQAMQLDKLQAEVSMLRSSHDEEVSRRAALGGQLNRLVQRLLDAAKADSLPTKQQDLETWLLQLEEVADA